MVPRLFGSTGRCRSGKVWNDLMPHWQPRGLQASANGRAPPGKRASEAKRSSGHLRMRSRRTVPTVPRKTQLGGRLALAFRPASKPLSSVYARALACAFLRKESTQSGSAAQISALISPRSFR